MILWVSFPSLRPNPHMAVLRQGCLSHIPFLIHKDPHEI